MTIQECYEKLLKYKERLLELEEKVNRNDFEINTLNKLIKREKDNEYFIRRKQGCEKQKEIYEAQAKYLFKNIDKVGNIILEYCKENGIELDQ